MRRWPLLRSSLSYCCTGDSREAWLGVLAYRLLGCASYLYYWTLLSCTTQMDQTIFPCKPASRWAPHPLYYRAAREPGLPFLRGEGKSVANFAIILYIEQHNCEQNLYTSSEGGSFSILSTQMK